MENKEKILYYFEEALSECRIFSEPVYLFLSDDEKYVEVVSRTGMVLYTINVSNDSGIAMIHDIVMAVR